MRHLTTILAALALTLGGFGCGAPSSSSAANDSAASSAASAGDEDPGWTAALIRKLDAGLRQQVRADDDGRLAVKVFFSRIPEDGELAALLLSRVGDQVVGEIPAPQLRRIAAREDVTRIETLSGVGY